jgi:tetratricopeptide (TPR) repeat protein
MASKTYGGHFDVAPPTAAEIAQIIRLPAQAAGLSFGVDPQTMARLDDVLCGSAAGSPDALPLLQHALQELFRLRTPDGELSFDAFRHLGGVEGAIGQRAEEVVGALNEAQRAALPRVLALLVTLSGSDDAVTSRRAPWAALHGAAERELVEALVDARLFVSELVGDAPGFGVAHEALLRRWPRVTAWIDEHRNALRVRGRLQLQAARWVSEERSGDLLLPQGKQLDEAVPLLASSTLSLSADEAALIKASMRRSAWRARLRIGTLAAIVGLSLLGAGLGLAAMAAKKVAQERRAEAEGLMGFMLGDFADKLRPLGRLDLLDSVSAKALGYLSSSANDDLTQTSLTQRATALQVLAEVRVGRGQPREALAALAVAHAILLRQDAGGENRWEVVKSLGANAFWQGQIHLNQNRWAEAQLSFEQYQGYGERLFEIDPSNPEAWIEQSYAHTNLGLLALRRGNADVAAHEFDASIGLKQRAAVKRPQDRTLAGELANSLSWLGNAKETLGRLGEAMQVYQRELALVEQLQLAAPNDSLWSSRVAGALQRRAKLRVAIGQQREALADLARAEQLLQGVVAREPAHRVWQSNLAAVRLERLRLEQSAGATATALSGLLALEEDARALTALDPKNSDWSRLLALTEQGIGLSQMQLGQAAPARSSLALALQRLQTLYLANPSDPRAAADLARTLVVQAELDALAGDREAMRAACAKAAKLIPAEARRNADYRILDPWVRSQVCLGNAAAVAPAQGQLARIGYQEASYLRYMANHNLGRQ